MDNYSVEPRRLGVPNVQMDRRFTVFDMDEIYRGPELPGQEVPNPRDMIIDYDNNAQWRVIETDYTNYTYRLEPFNPVPEFNGGIKIGGCAPSNSDTFRVYIDDRTHPASLIVDARLRVSGNSLESCRIFRGQDITETGEVISGYRENGRLVSNAIPLVLAAVENNVTVKSVAPGICTVADIEDGELITAVFYSTGNLTTPAAIARLYAVKTSIAMALEQPARQIVDIRLLSPHLSASEDKTLTLPVNLPLDDLILQAEIQYTDGKRILPIDGTRASFLGLRNSGSHDTFYISSNVGQKLDCLLTYTMGRNEIYLGDDLKGNVIQRDYSATTLEVDGSYSVKLFVVPTWLDSDRGWRLEYYLYDLERGNVYYATPHVQLGEGSDIFSPRLYGVKQRMIVRVDLSKVHPGYVAHIHPQTFHIALLADGTAYADQYQIEYVHDGYAYGEGILAYYDYSNLNARKLDISCGAKSKTEWLERLYRNSYPLYDMRSEDGPMDPTHVIVETVKRSYTIPIDSWMTPVSIDQEVKSGEAIKLRFLARTPNDELHLAMAPLSAVKVP